MPVANYDSLFGGKPGSAQKAMDAMMKEYGPDKGKRVFYATINRRKKGKGPKKRGMREIAGKR